MSLNQSTADARTGLPVGSRPVGKIRRSVTGLTCNVLSIELIAMATVTSRVNVCCVLMNLVYVLVYHLQKQLHGGIVWTP